MRNFVAFTCVAVGFFTAIAIGSWEIFSARQAALDSQINAAFLKNKLLLAPYDLSFSSPASDLSLLFVGDIMLSRAVGNSMENKNDYVFPFRLSADFLKNADITFGNLEGPISSRGKNQGSEYSFRANPQVVEGLVFAGFDALSLANNHMWDWRGDALVDTISILKENKISPVGAGEDFNNANRLWTHEVGGTKIGFLAYTNLYPKNLEATQTSPGISSFDMPNILKLIEKIQERREVHILVVSLHWGTEYETQAQEWQKDMARKLIDAGVDIVVGHHPHVVQEVEEYNGGVIFYSLGNFVFDQTFSKETMEGLAGEVLVSKGSIESVATHNVLINKTFQPTIESKHQETF